MTDSISDDISAATESDPASFARQQAAFWIDEINSYEKDFQSWTTRVKKIVKKYRDERLVQTNESGSRKYCILWSNIETIKPAIYARPPKAVVGRRWKDRDPVGRLGAMILERAENFSIDRYDLDGTLREAVQDYLLAGRGQIWVRYEPSFRQVPPIAGPEGSDQAAPLTTAKDEQGNAVDELDYEQTCRDYVHWDDFGHSPARVWKEVWWVYRRTFQTRRQLIDRFGQEIGAKIPLDWGPERNPMTGRFEKRSKAAIYEIWSKRDRKLYWISKGYPDGPLEVRDPLYRLSDFFPCPRPCYATLTTDRLVPVPDYIYYQDQAEEVDDLTARIGKLTDALKLVGVYAGNSEVNVQLGRMLSPTTDMQMIPVENWAMFADSKGIQGLIDWFPVDQVIKVLEGCIKLRSQLIQDIYQITGISDIVRGASDPEETATAQQIKSRWGGLRVRDRQAEVQRFARDVIRIEAEIVAQQFQPETLAAMTGVQLPSAEEKAQAQQQMAIQAQLAQQRVAAPGQPLPDQAPPQPDPELQGILDSPTWDDVMALLRSNELRDFRIDVETDSTIQPDEQEEKEATTELMTAVGNFLTAALPIIQAFPMTATMFGVLLMQAVRRFRMSDSVEEAIEEAMGKIAQAASQPAAPPPPDPAQINAEAKLRATEMQEETKRGKIDLDARFEAQRLEMERADAATERQARIIEARKPVVMQARNGAPR